MKRLAAGLMLVLSACTTLEPKLAPAAMPVPLSWPIGDPYLAANEAPLPSYTFRDVLRDARLQALIVHALANNRDLRVAAFNIAAARERVTITRANQLPRVDATAKAAVSGTGKGGTAQNYALGVAPSFDLDLFGRLRSLTRADQQRLLSTEAAARAVRLALVADIADAWLAYAADSSLLAIAEDTAASADKSVILTRARLEGGIAPATDLLQAQQVLETARQDVAEQRSARARDANLLQLLVGAPIDAKLLSNSIDEAGASILPPRPGLDSRVLLRRPDVVQAEYDLYAANAQIGAARAALFPTISLTGLLGLASSALGSLLSAGAFNWSAGGNLAYTIFNAGAGRANVRLTEAQRNAALASYERAIQTAFREVADALADRATMAERLRASTSKVAAAATTLRLVTARYRGGIDPYLTSLDAQRSLYAAQRERVAVELTRANNAVALYRALGADSLIAQTNF